jgi:hypothetical protein
MSKCLRIDPQYMLLGNQIWKPGASILSVEKSDLETLVPQMFRLENNEGIEWNHIDNSKTCQ